MVTEMVRVSEMRFTRTVVREHSCFCMMFWNGVKSAHSGKTAGWCNGSWLCRVRGDMYDYPELNHNVFCLTLDASTFFSQRQGHYHQYQSPRVRGPTVKPDGILAVPSSTTNSRRDQLVNKTWTLYLLAHTHKNMGNSHQLDLDYSMENMVDSPRYVQFKYRSNKDCLCLGWKITELQTQGLC